MTLKERFFEAIITGRLGNIDDRGITVSIKAFKQHFNEIHTDYINSFLPAATIEPRRHQISPTKFLFRVKKGLYRVHPDALEKHRNGYSLLGQRSTKNAR